MKSDSNDNLCVVRSAANNNTIQFSSTVRFVFVGFFRSCLNDSTNKCTFSYLNKKLGKDKGLFVIGDCWQVKLVDGAF